MRHRVASIPSAPHGTNSRRSLVRGRTGDNNKYTDRCPCCNHSSTRHRSHHHRQTSVRHPLLRPVRQAQVFRITRDNLVVPLETPTVITGYPTSTCRITNECHVTYTCAPIPVLHNIVPGLHHHMDMGGRRRTRYRIRYPRPYPISPKLIANPVTHRWAPALFPG